MAYDGTLKFDTKIDTKGLNKDLKSIDSALGGIQKSATIGLGAIATGLSVAGTAGVKFNAQVEQYTATFETFTGSVEGANAVVQELVEMGAKTPFEFNQLAEATQLMMAYGFSAEEATGYLTMLGDASQGNAEKLNSITTGFARMKSTGKVSLEYLNLMIENGFNPLQQVAEYTGMTMDEVYDSISKGKLTFEQIESAMVKMTSEGGQYFGLMEKQSKTLNGQLSTLSDTVNMKLGESFEFVNDKIKEILPNLIDFISNLDAKSVVKNIIALAAVLGTVIASVTALRGALALFKFVNFIKGIGGISKALGTLNTSIATVLTTIGPVLLIAAAIIAAIVLVAATIKHLWETNEQFRNIVMSVWASIQEVILNAWNKVLKPVLDALAAAFNLFITYILPLLIEIWEATFMAIATYLQGVWESIISPVLNGIIQALSGLINFLTGIFTLNWQQAWQGIVDIFGGIFGGIVAIAKAPINGVIGLINGAIAALNNIKVDIPKWVPFVGGQSWGVNLPQIPYLERGAIIRKGQVGLLEGKGAEAVVPLDRNKYWIRAVAKDMMNIMPMFNDKNRGQTINIYQPVKNPVETARAIRQAERYDLQGA